MSDLLLKIWPVLVAAGAAAVWGLKLAYSIAATVTRIEDDLKHQVTAITDHEARLRTLEEAKVRHSTTLEALHDHG